MEPVKMPEISSLGYVVLNVSDLAEWENFAVNLLGFMPADKSSHRLALRMDEYAQRLILNRSDEDDLAAAGWQLDTPHDLGGYAQQLREGGVEVTEFDDDMKRDRRVEAGFYCSDPNGVQHEFFFGPAYSPSDKPFHSSVMVGNGFVTGRQGMGHVLTIAQDYQKTVDFYVDVLGFRISDYIRDSETLPGVELDATFLHTHTGRHHSLATAHIPAPKKMHHLMVETQDLNDIGQAYDRCIEAGYDMFSGIGHHPNDKVISFYVQSPSGFGLEFGHGSVIIDDGSWEVKNYQQMSTWGHKPQSGKALL